MATTVKKLATSPTQSLNVSSSVTPSTVPAGLASEVVATPKAAAAPTTSSYSGGGGTASSYVAPATATAPAAPATPDFNSWLGQDAQYTAQMAALQKALSDYNASENAQQSQYDQQAANSLKDLGFTLGAGQSLTGLAGQTGDLKSLGSWNLDDQNTASGRAYQNQLNDFASRGLLQSTGYAQKLSDLLNSLGSQASQLGLGQQNFDNGIKQAIQSYGTNNTSQQQQAAADALSRYAAQFGVAPSSVSTAGTSLAK